MNRRLIGCLVIAGISGAVLYLAWQFGCRYTDGLQIMAFAFSFLAILWSTVAACLARLTSADPESPGQSASLFRFAALLCAVVPAVVESYVLVVKLLYVTTELIFGEAVFAREVRSVGTEGLWSLAALLIAAKISFLDTRNRKMAACIFWIVIAAMLWLFLLMPDYRNDTVGGSVRTGSTVILACALAFHVWLTVLVTRWFDRSRRWKVAWTEPDRLAEPLTTWPGMINSYTAVSIFLVAISGFHLAVPTSLPGWSSGQTMFLLAVALLVGAGGGYLRLAVEYCRGLAAASMGLTSLMFAALAVSTLPRSSEDLSIRYPGIFGALIVGLAAASLFWSWLYGVWQQQLNEGRSWTVAGRLIPQTVRFSYMSAALALVVATLLACWPRITGISATDDSMMSMVSGLATNLFLILVTLWIARRFGRLTFHILAILAVCTTMGFLVARLLPFSTHFG
ncbi:MAG: hypothetical protein ACYTHJ_14925 [Planctomycetota bacterium]|jgi:hypothetical protein